MAYNSANLFNEEQRLSYAGLCSAFLLDLLAPDDGWNEVFLKGLYAHLGVHGEMEASLWSHSGFSIDPSPFAVSLRNYGPENCTLLVEDLLVAATLYSVTEGYDARARVLIRKVAYAVGVPWDRVQARENLLSSELIGKTLPAIDKKTRKQFVTRGRLMWVGGAVVVGGTALAVTGALVTPTVVGAAGGAIAAVAGTTSAVTGAVAMLNSTAGVAIISSLLGIAGGGLAGYRMSKATGSCNEFKFVPLGAGASMKVCICISGWLDSKGDVSRPWFGLESLDNAENYALQWETKLLLALGNALTKFFAKKAVKLLVTSTLKMAGLGAVLHAAAIPATVIGMASLLDNPWSMVMDRSKKAGKLLAHILMERTHGNRPVTLVGYSMGARVIFYCLESLAKHRAYGIIEEALMFGCPMKANPTRWARAATVVAGRVVNGYCRTDIVLKVMYRTLRLTKSVAGLAPVKTPAVENVDLTSYVSGHLQYRQLIPDILDLFGMGEGMGEKQGLYGMSNEASMVYKDTCSFPDEQDNANSGESSSSMKAGAFVRTIGGQAATPASGVTETVGEVDSFEESEPCVVQDPFGKAKMTPVRVAFIDDVAPEVPSSTQPLTIGQRLSADFAKLEVTTRDTRNVVYSSSMPDLVPSFSSSSSTVKTDTPLPRPRVDKGFGLASIHTRNPAHTNKDRGSSSCSPPHAVTPASWRGRSHSQFTGVYDVGNDGDGTHKLDAMTQFELMCLRDDGSITQMELEMRLKDCSIAKKAEVGSDSIGKVRVSGQTFKAEAGSKNGKPQAVPQKPLPCVPARDTLTPARCTTTGDNPFGKPSQYSHKCPFDQAAPNSGESLQANVAVGTSGRSSVHAEKTPCISPNVTSETVQEEKSLVTFANTTTPQANMPWLRHDAKTLPWQRHDRNADVECIPKATFPAAHVDTGAARLRDERIYGTGACSYGTMVDMITRGNQRFPCPSEVVDDGDDDGSSSSSDSEDESSGRCETPTQQRKLGDSLAARYERDITQNPLAWGYVRKKNGPERRKPVDDNGSAPESVRSLSAASKRPIRAASVFRNGTNGPADSTMSQKPSVTVEDCGEVVDHPLDSSQTSSEDAQRNGSNSRRGLFWFRGSESRNKKGKGKMSAHNPEVVLSPEQVEQRMMEKILQMNPED